MHCFTGRNNKEGITGLIEHIQLRQMIYTVSALEDYYNTGEPWLEAGMIYISILQPGCKG